MRRSNEALREVGFVRMVLCAFLSALFAAFANSECRVIRLAGLMGCQVKVCVCTQKMKVCTVIMAVCNEKVFDCTVIVSTYTQTL